MTDRDRLWNALPTDLQLSREEVHVWRASLDQPPSCIQQLAQLLSDDEQRRAKRFYFEQDREHFIIGRGLLRTILARYVDIKPNYLQFCYGSHGKPALAATCGGDSLKFNVAHSAGLVLYAITREREIGIDLEWMHPIAEAEEIAKRFFSVREQAMIRALPSVEKQEAFFNCWVCKEAYLKATGKGLARPLDQIEVTLTLEKTIRLLSIKGDAQEAVRWTIQAMKPAPSYVAALAVEGQRWRLACWQWSEWLDKELDS